MQVLLQQQKVLMLVKSLLSPSAFREGEASVERRGRYIYEANALETILRRQGDRVAECQEMQKRVRGLGIQNVQLVETQLDDNNRAILIFTIVTVVFLPMTFVSGFFGMNLNGFSNSDAKAVHFWEIAAPLTVGIALPCIIIAFWGPLNRQTTRTMNYFRH